MATPEAAELISTPSGDSEGSHLDSQGTQAEKPDPYRSAACATGDQRGNVPTEPRPATKEGQSDEPKAARIKARVKESTHHISSSSQSEHTNSPPGEAARKTSQQPFLLAGWKWELVTWLLGTLGVAAILILLMLFNGKPLSSWQSHIQPSTMVAVLSQVAQSALVVSVSACIGQLKWVWLKQSQKLVEIERLDEATRGPEGSLMVLLHMIMGARNSFRLPEIFISLGSLTSLLMLAFGSFSQESLSIELREMRISSPKASILRAQYYNKGFPVQGVGLDFGASRGETDVFLSAAFATGIGSDQTLSNLKGECPSDKCSWNLYTSLAVCVGLQDVSSSIQDAQVNSNGNVTYGTGVNNLTLPELESLPGYSKHRPAPGSVQFWMDGYGRWRAHLNKAPTQPLHHIADVFTIYFPACSATDNTSALIGGDGPNAFQDLHRERRQNIHYWKAFKASFSLCLQTLNSTVTNGTTKTEVSGTETALEWHPSGDVADMNSHGEIYTTLPGAQERFAITVPALNYIGERIQTLFNANASLIPNGDNYYSEGAESLVNDLYGSNPWACDPSRGWAGFQNRMESVANSLTNAFRTSRNGSVAVSGTFYENELFIESDLRWISLPLLVWLCTTVLFFVTMRKTYTDDTPLWKSSALPLLQCMDPSNQLESEEQIVAHAKRTGVQLKSNGRSWYLAYILEE